MLVFRKMINEYMCSNYVAKQIMSEVAPTRFRGLNDDSKGIREINGHTEYST